MIGAVSQIAAVELANVYMEFTNQKKKISKSSMR